MTVQIFLLLKLCLRIRMVFFIIFFGKLDSGNCQNVHPKLQWNTLISLYVTQPLITLFFYSCYLVISQHLYSTFTQSILCLPFPLLNGHVFIIELSTLSLPYWGQYLLLWPITFDILTRPDWLPGDLWQRFKDFFFSSPLPWASPVVQW